MEDRAWKPDSWKKATVRRKLSDARQQIYRIALAELSPEDGAAILGAVLEICASELALEATENCARIGTTVRSISRKLELAVIARPEAETESDLEFAAAG